jgi:hypothetical protein
MVHDRRLGQLNRRFPNTVQFREMVYRPHALD